jgi:hypothetical protein
MVVLSWRIAGEARYAVAKTEPDPTENSFNKDESVPVSHLDCAAVSLFFRILSLFFVPFFRLLSFFLSLFLTYRTTGQGRGTERRRRDGGRDG